MAGDEVTARPVFLVGMMGAGKSTLGPLVAKQLGRAFVDTDDAIVADAGESVAGIFEREGEAGFRARERAAIEDAAKQGAVAALGGGAIAQPGAPERLASLGTVVYLRAQPKTLLARVGDASRRPLLAGLPAEERLAKLESLLDERGAAYATAAVTVDVDAWDAGALAREVAEAVRAHEAAGDAR